MHIIAFETTMQIKHSSIQIKHKNPPVRRANQAFIDSNKLLLHIMPPVTKTSETLPFARQEKLATEIS